MFDLEFIDAFTQLKSAVHRLKTVLFIFICNSAFISKFIGAPTRRKRVAYRQKVISYHCYWLECRFLDTEVDSSNPGISMLCP